MLNKFTIYGFNKNINNNHQYNNDYAINGNNNSIIYLMGSGVRLYNAQLRRFYNADSYAVSTEAGINPYTFVKNDPINYSDPTGHFFATISAFAYDIVTNLFSGIIADRLQDKITNAPLSISNWLLGDNKKNRSIDIEAPTISKHQQKLSKKNSNSLNSHIITLSAEQQSTIAKQQEIIKQQQHTITVMTQVISEQQITIHSQQAMLKLTTDGSNNNDKKKAKISFQNPLTRSKSKSILNVQNI